MGFGESEGHRAKGKRSGGGLGLRILDFGLRNITFWILDCAHVKSALPFHIRENLTGQVPVKYVTGKQMIPFPS